MSTTDEVYRIATDQLGTKGVADVNLTADDGGWLTLVGVDTLDSLPAKIRLLAQ